MIIVMEFFAFYAYWRSKGPGAPPVHLHIANYVGYLLWDGRRVERLQDRVYRIYSDTTTDALHSEVLAEMKNRHFS